MPLHRYSFRLPLLALALVASSTFYALAQRAPTTTKVRGTIESVDGNDLSVKSRDGQDVRLHMTDGMKVLGITRVSLADVKVGSFVGATTVPGPDGSQNAVEVHVFPENMRGTGEGSRPYDLRPNSSMTNATVSSESVAANDGHTLLIKYKGGEKKVVVSPDTPVVTYVPGDKADLKDGAKVIASVKQRPDGSFDTSHISVGRDGITPPM